MREFAERRVILAQKLLPNTIAVLPSHDTKSRNSDVEFPFRQDSNFYYLTGFKEPEAICVLVKDLLQKLRCILFLRPRQPDAERWTGPRLGVEAAVKDYGFDEAYAIEEFPKRLHALLSGKDYIYHSLGHHLALDETIITAYKDVTAKAAKGIQAPAGIMNFLPFIHEMRLIKEPQELQLMKKAAYISAQAHKKLMKACITANWEYELEGIFSYECQMQGARALAYSSIVANGANANFLHYTSNDQPLKKGDLVLVDAGCEYEYYASDITRTYPVSGRFTEPQKAIYQLVLDSQLCAIEKIRPGLAWTALQETILEVLVKGLVNLGLLKGSVEELIKNKAYLKFYMHSSGHWLGLDVHDTGFYHDKGEARKLEAGMILTVEPGLYISANEAGVDPKWWDIGVRIEDDILVTPQGSEILSKDAPKTIAEIEAWMQ